MPDPRIDLKDVKVKYAKGKGCKYARFRLTRRSAPQGKALLRGTYFCPECPIKWPAKCEGNCKPGVEPNRPSQYQMRGPGPECLVWQACSCFAGVTPEIRRAFRAWLRREWTDNAGPAVGVPPERIQMSRMDFGNEDFNAGKRACPVCGGGKSPTAVLCQGCSGTMSNDERRRALDLHAMPGMRYFDEHEERLLAERQTALGEP